MKKNLFFTLIFCFLSFCCSNSFAQGPSEEEKIAFDPEVRKQELREEIIKEKNASMKKIEGLLEILLFFENDSLEALDKFSIKELLELTKEVRSIKEKLNKRQSILSLSRSIEGKTLLSSFAVLDDFLRELVTKKRC